MKKLLLLIAFSLLIFSCSEDDDSVSTEAEQIDFNYLSDASGYAWFNATVATYTPYDSTIQIIQQKYDTSMYDVVMYVKPSCSCDGTQKKFPYLVKSLRAAGVPDSEITIYSINKHTDKHPRMNELTLTDLPTFYLYKNGVPFANILESKIGTGRAEVEDLLLNAIEK